MSLESFLEANYKVLSSEGDEELRICCPSCGDDGFHGYMNVRKNVYVCFKGCPGMTAFKFLTRIHGLSTRDAKTVLGDSDDFHPAIRDSWSLASLTMQSAEEENKYLSPISLPVGVPPLPTAGSVRVLHGWKHLRRRFGSSAAVRLIEKFKFRMVTSGEYSGRLVLPAYRDDMPVFFQARAVFPANAEPKYKNPPNARRPLFFPYGLNNGRLFLCEGYFDGLALGAGAAVCFGSGLSQDQLSDLFSLRPSEITLCFDADEAGRRGTVSMMRVLDGSVPSVFVTPDYGERKDPGSFGLRAKEHVMRVRKRFDFRDYWL